MMKRRIRVGRRESREDKGGRRVMEQEERNKERLGIGEKRKEAERADGRRRVNAHIKITSKRKRTVRDELEIKDRTRGGVSKYEDEGKRGKKIILSSIEWKY